MSVPKCLPCILLVQVIGLSGVQFKEYSGEKFQIDRALKADLKLQARLLLN